MFAIIQDRGKQYKVSEGQILWVDLLPNQKGEEIEFDKVLVVSKEEETHVGTPFVEKAKVKAKVLGQEKAKKIHVYKFKRRKGYKRKQGHRQRYTSLKVVSIQTD
ncbi:MAG: 50S ribosomal protein L21 [Planctomycetota bacterium]|nr:MAG: 50S ribosomal protein L21 [Planctomycetota bacterium]